MQGEGQITLFLKHWRTDTMVSRVLRIALAWSQWQSGLSKSILQDTRTKLPHLESRWIKSLRRFLYKIKASIQLDNSRVVPSERMNDIYIMEYAIRCKLFNDKELKIINYCRQYIHVTTVSELFNSEGTKILPHMFKCHRPPWFNKHQFIIIQRRPSDYQIRNLWQKLCRQWCTHDGTAAAFLNFGRWTNQGLEMRTRRESYITQQKEVYHWVDSCYWLLETNSTTTTYYHPSRATDWIPDNLSTPISVTQTSNTTENEFTVEYLSYSHPQSTYRHQSPYDDFQDYLRRLPDWEQQLLQNIQFNYGALSTMYHIQELLHAKQQLYAVSDGSMAHNTTTFGWILGTTDGQRLAWCSGPGFGPPTSHRAECWGQLSVARFLHHLPKFSSMTYPQQLQVVPMSDNQGLMTSLTNRAAYSTPYPNATLQPDWDLIEEIYATYQDLNIDQVKYRWIKGHQDTDTPYDELSIPAQLNVDADRLADEFLETHSSPRPKSPLVPKARCLLQVRDKTVHGHYTETIREAASLHDLFGYLRHKFKWTKQVIQNIKWEWFRLAANNYSHTDNHLTKLVYDQLPTQAYKSKQGGQTWLSPNCRLCQQEPETFDHLLHCNHTLGQQFRKALPLKVLTYCKQKNTPHNFHATIVIALENWVRGQAPLESIPASAAVHKLIHAQKQIGWTRFLRGFLSQQWQDYLEYELNHNHEAPAPNHFDYDQFFSGLIKVMWEQQSKFWMDFQQHLKQRRDEPQSQEKLDEYKLEIRHLYSLRGQVLPQHRDDYFPQRLSEFLDYSTPSQLQSYIANYKPAIRRSIKEAHKRSINSKRIYQFSGFQRQPHHQPRLPRDPTIRSSSPNIRLRHSNTTNVASNSTQRTLTQTTLFGAPAINDITSYTRERPPHKHSRWKPIQMTQLRFLAFFTNKRTPFNDKEKSD